MDELDKERIRQNTDGIKSIRTDIGETTKLLRALESKLTGYIGTLSKVEEQHAAIEKMEANVGSLMSLKEMVEHFKNMTLSTEESAAKLKEKLHELEITLTKVESTIDNSIVNSIGRHDDLLVEHSRAIDEYEKVVSGMKGIKVALGVIATILGIVLYASRISNSAHNQEEAMDTLVKTVQTNSELLASVVDEMRTLRDNEKK